jgi:hypothetical protein
VGWRGASKAVPAGPPVCGRCEGRIAGSYVRALDRDWHPEHFLCGGCGFPIDGCGFVENGNIAYHRRCHDDLFAPKCFYCGTPMAGKYLRDAWGAEFCEFHSTELAKCEFCGRLVDGSRVTGRATEGGLQCNVCRETAVDTPEDAAPLYDRILEWATGRTLVFPAVPLRLTDLAGLVSNSSEPKGNRTLGSTRISTETCSGATVKVEVLSIDLLRELPAVLFCAVAAHEAGHAWLRAIGVDGLSPAEEEGFCELLAFSWLREQASPDRDFYAERIAKNDDAIYGNGFRQVRALSGVRGLAGLVESLRNTKRLPATPLGDRGVAV